MRLRLLLPGCMSIIVLLASCAGSRVQTLTKSTQEALELIRKEAQRAIQMTAEKVRNNEVDPDIGKQLVANLEVAEKKVSEQIALASEIDKSNSREAQLKFAEKSNVIIQSALTDLKSLNDLYDVSTFSQFETATFFPSGGYTIPAENMEEAKASIEPIAQRIIKFIGDHPRQHFVAVIVCSGFSDETPVGKDSYLYNSIVAKLPSNNPTRQEMNKKISELRAKTIATLLVDIIKTNEGMIPNPNLINYDIRWLGRGEALPYPNKVKDYMPSDKRRRLVSLVWNVLPGSLYMKSVEDNAAVGVK
ncbi:MAG TPA: hypothetical protein VLD19_16570 [Chitinophagaceae bacterium]|nr:hypothetical protein [Chitinophagaceae bacterium]